MEFFMGAWPSAKTSNHVASVHSHKNTAKGAPLPLLLCVRELSCRKLGGWLNSHRAEFRSPVPLRYLRASHWNAGVYVRQHEGWLREG